MPMLNQIPYIGSRAVIGMFYMRLHADIGARYIPYISMPFESNQPIETYAWLGQVPAMREWIGGRHAIGFKPNVVTVANKKFESTIQVSRDDRRYDKTGQLMIRIGEQAKRTTSHWAYLMSQLMLNGASSACYDGQYFFSASHQEGKSPTQSNLLSINIDHSRATSTARSSSPPSRRPSSAS